MAILRGSVPTRDGLNLLRGDLPSKTALCETNLSTQKETLSFRSRSQHVRMLRCFLPGRMEGQEEQHRKTGDQKRQRQQVSTLTIYKAQRKDTERLINASASSSLPASVHKGLHIPALLPALGEGAPLGWHLPASPTTPQNWGPRSQEVPNLSKQMSVFGAEKMSLFFRHSAQSGLK